MTVLFIRGINDRNTVTPHLTPDGKVGFEFDGSCSIFRYMTYSSDQAWALLLFPERGNQRAIHVKTPPRLIFNEISDPDSHKDTLKRCIKLCEKFKVPVINHPQKILQTSRDRVSKTLEGIPGVRIPRTVQVAPRAPTDIIDAIRENDLEYPVIVRKAGIHGGKSNVLLTSSSEIENLHRYAFDGSSFYITQFVDYQDKNGLYTKYRLVVIDGEPVLRHMLMDTKWMIHASSQAYMDEHPELWLQEEKKYAEFMSELGSELQPAVQEISHRLGLEYFGIDCSIDSSGEMLIFEANANMNVLFNKNPKYDQRVALIKQKVGQLIRNRTRA